MEMEIEMSGKEEMKSKKRRVSAKADVLVVVAGWGCGRNGWSWRKYGFFQRVQCVGKSLGSGRHDWGVVSNGQLYP